METILYGYSIGDKQMKLYEFYYKNYDEPNCKPGEYQMIFYAMTTSKKDAKQFMKERKYDKNPKKSLFKLNIIEDISQETIMKYAMKYAGKLLHKKTLSTKYDSVTSIDIDIVMTADEHDIVEMTYNGEYVQYDGFCLYDGSFWHSLKDPIIYDKKYRQSLMDLMYVELFYLHGGDIKADDDVIDEVLLRGMPYEIDQYKIFLNEFGNLMKGYEE